ncbi:MAG: tetratricopeptide repeat protein [Xanthomonadales bacterium]|nr:tetratricopeptide repeat protein [Xanthomonadales bacterium]
MLEDILKLHQTGELDAAETAYRQWLADHPDDPEASHLLALLRRQRGDLGQALELTRQALEHSPDQAPYHNTLGNLLLQQGQWRSARQAFQAAMRLDPNHMGSLVGAAQAALIEGDLGAARETLAKAERVSPDHRWLRLPQANLAQALGDHDKAVRLYLAALEENSNDATIHMSLARSFGALGRTTFAEQALDNALKLKPDYVMARVALGQLRLKDGRFADALTEFERALEHDSDHAPALAGRGDARRRLGDTARALEDYRQAHAAAPDAPGLAAILIQTLLITGNEAEARQQLADSLAALPRDVALRQVQVTVAARDGEDALLSALEDWRAADPGNPEARERLAALHESRGRFDEAVALARDTLKNNSRSGFARLVLARSALRAGNFDEVQEQINLLPENVLPAQGRAQRALLRGLARDALGDHDGALEAWLAGRKQLAGAAPLVPMPQVAQLQLPPAPEPSTESAEAPAPVFLIGLPGAGTESLATLASALGVRVLADRFSQQPRVDAITSGEYGAMVKSLAEDPNQASLFRDRYLAALAGVGELPRPDLVDWLPFADLRLLTLLRHAFPAARYLVAERDLRDCLINWLSVGTAQHLASDDPKAAAQWLLRANQHLDSAKLPEEHTFKVSADDLAAPQTLAPRLLQFLGLPERPLPAGLDIVRSREGFPAILPANHWQRYQAQLAEPFSLMTD